MCGSACWVASLHEPAILQAAAPCNLLPAVCCRVCVCVLRLLLLQQRGTVQILPGNALGRALEEYGPFDAIHVGAAAAVLPQVSWITWPHLPSAWHLLLGSFDGYTSPGVLWCHKATPHCRVPSMHAPG